MNFAEAAKRQENFTRTENGAVAIKSTGHACVDLFATIGSLRDADTNRIDRLFADAYAEDPLAATKIVFYGRDIRGGLGERYTFRTLLQYMATMHPEALIHNIDLIGEYGRYDDLYSLIGTPLEDAMWASMKKRLELDLEALNSKEYNKISLLAKWIKSADASSQRTRQFGILTANKLGYPVYNFKRIIKTLRKQIRIVESQMSANKWGEINYPSVPSRASMIYRDAFKRHDGERYNDFINKATKGEAKINSSTLYPYDLVEKYYHLLAGCGFRGLNDDMTVEAQWRQLPNYIDGENNVLVIADTSGSMYGRPIFSAVGLAIYFAERNKGVFHNLWMNFSNRPSYQVLKGETLYQKIKSIDRHNWDNTTNLKAAFNLVLKTSEDNHLSQDDIPKAIVVISDMEIDNCGDRDWTFYDKMKSKFAKHGYQIPNVVFWNVNSRHDVFHADSKRRGVQLVSGQSACTFKNIMECIGMTPYEAMRKVIDSERYKPITI